MFELQINACPRDQAESLSELLESLGSLSITMTDRHDHPILEPEIGTSPLWPEVIINALYETKINADYAKQMLSKKHADLDKYIKEIPEQDWEQACMVDFKPIQFGENFWVCPSWIEPPDPKAKNLILDPGLAFGTGTHQTTSLCLQWLARANLNQMEVIDYGCGSGILALAALKLGTKKVFAVDIDPQALIATENNAHTNSLLSKNLIIVPPEKLSKPVDLLIANILLGPLISLKDRFRGLLKPNGILVVSGILATQIEELNAAYEDTFQQVKKRTLEDWGLMQYRIL